MQTHNIEPIKIYLLVPSTSDHLPYLYIDNQEKLFSDNNIYIGTDV